MQSLSRHLATDPASGDLNRILTEKAVGPLFRPGFSRREENDVAN